MNFSNVSFFNKLKTQEFPELFYHITSIKSVDEVELDYVKVWLERALAHDNELQFVMNMQKPHPLTKVLNRQCLERKNYLVSMGGIIRSNLQSPSQSNRDAAEVLSMWMKRHQEYLYRPSAILQNRMVKNMTTEMSHSEDFSEALGTLDLVSEFDTIKALTVSIDRNFKKRANQQSTDVLKSIEIRSNVYATLLELLTAVSMAQKLEEPGEHFYLDYCREINRYLDIYRATYDSRITRRRNGQAKQDQPEEEIDNGEHPIVNTRSAKPKPFTLSAMNGLKVDVAAMNGNAIQQEAGHEKPTNGGVVHDIPATSEIVDVEHQGAKNGLDQMSEDHL